MGGQHAPRTLRRLCANGDHAKVRPSSMANAAETLGLISTAGTKLGSTDYLASARCPIRARFLGEARSIQGERSETLDIALFHSFSLRECRF